MNKKGKMEFSYNIQLAVDNLNPIKYIRKSIKRELSPLFIETHFKKFSKSKTCAKEWITKFLNTSIIN